MNSPPGTERRGNTTTDRDSLMQRIAVGLSIVAMLSACRGESGGCGRGGRAGPAPRQKPSAVAGLEAKYGRPLRVTHASAIGAVRGHRWTEDERLLVVWSTSAALVFELRTERVLTRVTAAPGRHIEDASFSSDGRWVGVASGSGDTEPSTLELFAVGESSPRKRFAPVARTRGASWQMGRDSRTIAWLEITSPRPKPGLRLRVDPIEGGGSHYALELPAVEGGDPTGLELGKSAQVMVVRRTGQLSVVEFATDRAWHWPSVSDPILAASGEAVAWANSDGFVVWKHHRDGLLSLADARCAPREWPARAAAKELFSEDERSLATSGSAGVCLWDVDTGRLRTVLQRPGRRREDDMPKSPSGWILAGRGLVTDDSELWDVEHRRLVRSGFADWSQQGPLALLLDAPVENDGPARLSSVDAQFALRDIAQATCSVDLQGGQPLVLGLLNAAAVACQPDPWIVDLRTSQSRRLSLPSSTALTASPRGRLLTLMTRRGLFIADPGRPGSEHPLLAELNAGILRSYDGQRLWLADSPTWQKFQWTTVDFTDKKHARLASGSSTRRCSEADTYLVGPHFGWSRPDSGRLVLCDLMTGRELGTLENPGIAKLMAVNPDATLALVGDPKAGARFWFPREKRTVDLDLEVYAPVFAGPHTVVGVADGKVVMVDATKKARSPGWDLSAARGESLLAADLVGDLVVAAGTRPTLRRLSDGKVVGQLPVPALTAAAFGPDSQLVASDNQRIWVWHLPSSAPIGELLFGPTGILYIAEDGRFETTDPVANWQSSLACTVGPELLSLATCLDNLYEPDLLMQALAPRSASGSSALDKADHGTH